MPPLRKPDSAANILDSVIQREGLKVAFAKEGGASVVVKMEDGMLLYVPSPLVPGDTRPMLVMPQDEPFKVSSPYKDEYAAARGLKVPSHAQLQALCAGRALIGGFKDALYLKSEPGRKGGLCFHFGRSETRSFQPDLDPNVYLRLIKELP